MMLYRTKIDIIDYMKVIAVHSKFYDNGNEKNLMQK